MSYPNLYLNDVNMHWSGLNRNETQSLWFSEPVIHYADWVVVGKTRRGLDVTR